MEELQLKPENLLEEQFCKAVVEWLERDDKDYVKMAELTVMLEQGAGSNKQTVGDEKKQ